MQKPGGRRYVEGKRRIQTELGPRISVEKWVVHLKIEGVSYQCCLSESGVDPLQVNSITEGSMSVVSENHRLLQSERTSFHGA